MTRRSNGARLSITLWTAFAAIIIAVAVVLLRACGPLLPLTSVLPARGWNFCPTTPLALTAEAKLTDVLRNQANDLARDLALRRLACASHSGPPPLELPRHLGSPQPQQTALLEPPPTLPADRWNQKDLSLLKGCWVLGHDAGANRGAIGSPEREDHCINKAERWCFNANGVGQAESTVICPKAGVIYCKGPMTARFGSDATLSAITSAVPLCQRGLLSKRHYASYSCRRVDDTRAMCRKTSIDPLYDLPGAQGEEEFHREQ